MKKVSKFTIFALAPLFVFSFSSPAYAAEAKLYLSPETGIYTIGETFPVEVIVDTGGSPINAAEGELTFNTDDFSVEEISTKNSILNSWIALSELETANETGIIEFSGITPNVYTGEKGRVLTLSLKPLRNVAGELNITAGAILAADGKASNIITAMQSALYSLTSQKIIPADGYFALDNAPKAPVVFSPTHPDGEKWYKENSVEFGWEIPSGVLATRILLDKLPYTLPTVLYNEPLSRKRVEGLDGGIWYFHVQLKNEYGWGSVAHFSVKIDSEAPEYFNITEQERTDLSDPKVVFYFDARDKVSPVKNYEIKIDDKEFTEWYDEGSHLYYVPVLPPGKHSLVAKALDSAGNYLIEMVNFEISALETPLVIDYPDSIISGKTLTIKGVTLPEAGVLIWVQKGDNEPKSYTVISKKDGTFSFITDDTDEEGVYKIWAETKDERGASSIYSPQISVAVGSSAFMQLASVGARFLSVTIPLVAMVILLGLLMGYVWYRADDIKEKLKPKKQD